MWCSTDDIKHNWFYETVILSNGEVHLENDTVHANILLSIKAIKISPSYLLDTKMRTGCLYSGALCDTDHENKKRHVYALSHSL